MIKGGNRRMFRKPGRARQAIGILASSKELMDAAQAGQMPMQPVQSFANGGFADTAYGLMGLAPPGFNLIGEEMTQRYNPFLDSVVRIKDFQAYEILLEHGNNLEWIC